MENDSSQQEYNPVETLQALLDERGQVVNALLGPQDDPFEEVQVTIADTIVILTRLFVGIEHLRHRLEEVAEL